MSIDQRTKYLTPKQQDAEVIKRRLKVAEARDERIAKATRRQAPQSKKGRAKNGLPKKLPQSVNVNDYPLLKPSTSKPDFYQSKEWRNLRWNVLRSSDGKCVYCGRSRALHNIVIHVDHIKPRSKFPHLALVRSNLQVTCEDCNLGKSDTTIGTVNP